MVSSQTFCDMAFSRKQRPTTTRGDNLWKRNDFYTCDACGFSYPHGSHDGPLEHKRHHHFHAQPFLLKPIPMLATLSTQIAPGINACILSIESKINPRFARLLSLRMARIATAFRREFGYDCTQWCLLGTTDPNKNTVGYLLCTPDGIQIGGIAFRYRQYTGAPPGWAMQWAWLQPAFRRRGIVTAIWPSLENSMGAFCVEPPLSHAMSGLLNKMGRSSYPIRNE